MSIFTTLLLLISEPACSQTFTDVAQTLGVQHQFGLGDFGGGVSFYDFNGDGWDDLTFATAPGDSVYFYVNTGGAFQKIVPCPIDFTGESKQVIWADIDNDGDEDLFVAGHLSGNHLYENTGNLTLVDITAAAGISTDSMATFGASWADFDKDGLLDLYIINRTLGGTLPPNRNFFYKNLGNNTFQDVTLAIGVPDSNNAAFCASFFDMNNDGWEDIYIAQDKYLIPNVLYKHNGNGGYTDASIGSGANRGMDAMCVAVADYNNDEYQDIYVTNTAGGNSLFLNNGNETFTDTANGSGVGFFGPSWGANWLDYDNDLDLDLYVSGENIGAQPGPSRMYGNDGTGHFAVPAGIGFLGDTLRSFSNALGDIDNDGYVDIAVSNFDQFYSTLWQNSGGSNHWIKLELEGTMSNRNAVGTRIEYWLGGAKYMRYIHCGISFIGQNSGYECIGLGSYEQIDTLKIKWTNGHVDTYHGVCGDRKIKIVENVTSQLNPTISSASGYPAFCAGDSLLLDAGPYAGFLWSTGDTTRTITVSAADTFWVAVEDSFGFCGESASVITAVAGPPQVQEHVDPVLCHGDTTGAIFPNPIDPYPPYSYSWSTGSLDTALSPLAAGVYAYTVTNAVGCSATNSLTISEPPALQLATSSTPSGNTNCIGTAYLSAGGGTPPYSILWSDSMAQTTDTASGLCPGVYWVTLTDSNGCTLQDTVAVADTTAAVGTEFMGLDGQLEMQVMPNPAHAEMRIQLNAAYAQHCELEIVGVDGSVIWTMEGIELEGGKMWMRSINLEEFPTGAYTLVLRSGAGVLTQRLLILK